MVVLFGSIVTRPKSPTSSTSFIARIVERTMKAESHGLMTLIKIGDKIHTRGILLFLVLERKGLLRLGRPRFHGPLKKIEKQNFDTYILNVTWSQRTGRRMELD